MTASGDTTISEWNVVTGELVATYKSHTGSVKSVHVNRDEPSRLLNMQCTCLHFCCMATFLTHTTAVLRNIFLGGLCEIWPMISQSPTCSDMTVCYQYNMCL